MGIVGLPNVGKSTIFNALTSAKAEAANYPFCTIEPNTGIVRVPDHRLADIAQYIKPQKLVPTTMEFVDIAGLVKGASQGEGLGNQFLGHIRETQAIAHVVRCFDDSDVVHVDGSLDPLRDIATIDTELMLADLATVEKRFTQVKKASKGGTDKRAAQVIGVLEPVKEALEAGKPVRALRLSREERALIADFHLITEKPVLYIANVDETGCPAVLERLQQYAASEGSQVVALCGKIESELAELELEERQAFLQDLGIAEPGLARVIRAGYELLGFATYFTAGETEVRAWTIEKGWKAPAAAGVIHTDFERGFIRAEVYHYDDLMRYKSEQAIRDAGALRVEGKEYVVKDGDIMHFRFAV